MELLEVQGIGYLDQDANAGSIVVVIQAVFFPWQPRHSTKHRHCPVLGQIGY